ncbi:MAG: sulfatase-like hydrolase/transferase [Planctomycetota bacterium]|jgi:arylsulfatase A-like enzyme
MPDRPHIVIFVPDHYRGDVLGHLGNPGAVTPNLDRLVAEEGVSFSNAFCQNPVCTPSRCSFMSGWYPHVRGHRSMEHLMHPGEPVLLKTLKDAGYWVWWGGKNDLVAGRVGTEDYCDVRYRPYPPPLQRGDRTPESGWRGQPGDDTYYSFMRGKTELLEGEEVFPDRDQAMVEGAVDLIREAPLGRPLCIYLPLMFPHLPYSVEEPWFSAIDRAKVPPRIPTPEDGSGKPSIEAGLRTNYNMKGWSEDRWRELKAVYYGMCARVDHQVGMVVEALKQKGIWDDTLFTFFSDHGEYAGDYGLIDINQNTFEDSLAKVPFVVKPPKGTPVKPGTRDCLVELLDIVATVEELTGLRLEEDHFSRSLVPLLDDPGAEHRDAVFCEGGRLHGESHCTELQVGSALRPDGHYYPRLKLQRSEGPEHGKAVMCRTGKHKYVRRLYEKDELYDLAKDPQELANVVDDPAYAQVLAALRERTLTFFMETGDVVPRHIDRRDSTP